MRKLKNITENKIIDNLTKSLTRSPLQINKIHETDAEIIRVENANYDLAITIDTISEEIKSGLYKDPYLIGWMTVMVNLSDLSAVGAVPIGIVISQILSQNLSDDFLRKLQSGINDACLECGTFVLGGDTNLGNELIISGCAIGNVNKEKYLKRIGCKPGDKVYMTGKAGIGNAFAAQQLLSNYQLNHNFDSCYELKYFPKAKLEWRDLLLKYSTSCIDTSDGVISSLDQLMRLNNVGFKLRYDWEQTLGDSAKQLFEKINLPEWLLLAGEHGEFELLFSICEDQEKQFLFDAENLNLNPNYLANVTEEANIKINLYNKLQTLDTEKIRNLAFDKNFSPENYLQKLLEIHALLKCS